MPSLACQRTEDECGRRSSSRRGCGSRSEGQESWARAAFLLGVDFGDLEVCREKASGCCADNSVLVFCMPGHLAYPLQRPQRPPAPSTRPGSGDVVGWGGTLPPRPPTHARAHSHTFGRGKLRPGTERTPAKVTSGGGAGSGSGSVHPWTPRPAGPTLLSCALGGSARARRLRAPRGRSGRAGRGGPLLGPGCEDPSGLMEGAAAVSRARGAGLQALGTWLASGWCGAAPGTRGGRDRTATALCSGPRSGVLAIRVGAGAFHANAVPPVVRGSSLGVALCPSPPFPSPCPAPGEIPPALPSPEPAGAGGR